MQQLENQLHAQQFEIGSSWQFNVSGNFDVATAVIDTRLQQPNKAKLTIQVVSKSIRF